MRKILFILFTWVILTIALITAIWMVRPTIEADTGAMQTANLLYENGDFSQAALIYEQIINQGVSDSILHYNLGNIYSQGGDLERAILNYQRAAQLDPRDPDIRANLSMARSLAAGDDLATTNTPGLLVSSARITQSLMTINETALLALSFWFAFCLLFIVWRIVYPGRLRNGIGYTAGIFLLLLIVIGVSLGGRVYLENVQPSSVINFPKVTINSEPAEQYSTDFNLISSAEVNQLGMQSQ